MLTLEKSHNLLDRSEAAHALKGGEGDGHLWLVVGIWVVLGNLSVKLRCQLLQKGKERRDGSLVTGHGFYGETHKGGLMLGYEQKPGQSEPPP